MTRLLAMTMMVLTIGTLAFASASGLTVTSRNLGSGKVALSACDADGFTYAYTIDTTSQITTVTVSGIAAACAGGTLRVTLTNGTASVGAGSVPGLGSGGTATVSISPTPLSNTVTANRADVEGP